MPQVFLFFPCLLGNFYVVDASGDEGMEDEASGGPWFPPHTSWLGTPLPQSTAWACGNHYHHSGWLVGWPLYL